jgi:MFS transporter, Spinster family, sphingosine-1-phosphate transporter
MTPSRYRYYLLALLTALSVLSLVDRVALGLLLEGIKADLGLSDTQLGLLNGIAFALFYSVMGIPIARWADRGNRATIISLSALVGSAMVSLCGTAETFVQLLLIRVVVAVGEAGCFPPAFSLMADYFTRAERPRATAIYGLGAPVAIILGLFVGGYLNEAYGWRTTFVLLGLPGVLLAVCAWFTLREPRVSSCRVEALEPHSSTTSQPTFRDVFVTLAGNSTFRHLLLCLSALVFCNFGIGQWIPTFFIRSHGLSTAQVGLWLSVMFGLGGFIGTYLAGEMATRYAAGNEPFQLRAMAIGVAAAGALAIASYLTSNVHVAFVLMGLYSAGLATVNGPLYAAIQTLVPDRMRAVAFALVFLFSNLIGMGFGPLVAGVLSDVFRPWAGADSLRYALLALTPGYLWVTWHAWKAGQTISRDLARQPTDSSELDLADPRDRRVPPVPFERHRDRGR